MNQTTQVGNQVSSQQTHSGAPSLSEAYLLRYRRDKRKEFPLLPSGLKPTDLSRFYAGVLEPQKRDRLMRLGMSCAAMYFSLFFRTLDAFRQRQWKYVRVRGMFWVRRWRYIGVGLSAVKVCLKRSEAERFQTVSDAMYVEGFIRNGGLGWDTVEFDIEEVEE